MRLSVFTLLILFFLKGWASAQPFRLHVTKEPTTYDAGYDLSNGFVLQNIHARLFRWSEESGLKGELATQCKWKKLKLYCELQKRFWSNGEVIQPEQVRDSFRRLLSTSKVSPHAFLLKYIKSPEHIRVENNNLIFEFQKRDEQFTLKLSHPGLAVLHPNFNASTPEKNFYSGPYFVSKVQTNKTILLKPNTYHQAKPKLEIEFLILNDDATASSLYEQGRLDFLRRVPAAFIPSLKDKPDFYMLPTFRLDHFALSGPGLSDKKLRQALVTSIDYLELQKLLSAPQPIGCPGIAKNWLQKQLCHSHNKAIAKWDASANPNLTLTYNAAGGDDHRRVAEWLQAQWNSKLGLQVRVRSLENKIFLQELEKQNLQIYRRGVSPDFPSCWAAVEAFHSQSPNFVFKDLGTSLDQKIEQLELADTKKSKALCTEIIQTLMDDFRIIPTGQIYWAMRASSRFKNWQFNELGELDLSRLNLTVP